jgi:RHS repeat-associated protein
LAVVTADDFFLAFRDKANSLLSAYSTKKQRLSSRDISPFGVIEREGIAAIPLAFQGQLHFPSLGLYYFRNRFYDPKISRFIAPDPLGLAGGFNEYDFSRNNPLKFVDPLGLFPMATPEVTKVGSRAQVGYINTGIFSKIFPSRPQFPKANYSFGINESIGERLGGMPIFANVNSYFTEQNAKGGAGRFGQLLRGGVNEIAPVLTSALTGGLAFSEKNRDVSGQLRKLLAGENLTSDITPGKLVGALFRTPFSHFRENSHWLYQEQPRDLRFYFPDRSDPYIRKPQAGYLDFLIFPSAFNVTQVMHDLPLVTVGGSFVIPLQIQDSLTYSAIASLNGVATTEAVRTLDGLATLEAAETVTAGETLKSEDAGATESLLDTNCRF